MASAALKSQLNPVSPDNLLDPVPLYRELREHDPVHWSDTVQAWLITRHADVMNCFRDPRLSADRSKIAEHQLRLVGISEERIQEYMAHVRQQMVLRDGPEHLRLRRQTNPAFTPQMVDAWCPTIRRTMNTLMDRVRHLGHMDLVSEISYPLPQLVVAELLGIPGKDRENFRRWTEPSAQLSSPVAGIDLVSLARRAVQGTLEVTRYLTAIVEERRREPADDLISQLLRVQESGAMSEGELVATLNLILTAGHLTTTDQLSNGIHELLLHPDQFQKLREDLGLLRSAVEEMVRFCPPMPFMHRIATENFQLHGRTIRKGDLVFLGLASANRDPAIYPEPDRFDITRSTTQKNMTFGFGPHHCVGSGLARRELEIAFEVLVTSLPGLHLEPGRLPQLKCTSLAFRGFESLHVRW
jgi:cytochrome P450 PksS